MSRRIQQERLNRGWSRAYVAYQTGLSVEAVRLIEAGKRDPSYSVLVRLEDLFQLNHRTLFAESTGASERPDWRTVSKLDTERTC